MSVNEIVGPHAQLFAQQDVIDDKMIAFTETMIALRDAHASVVKAVSQQTVNTHKVTTDDAHLLLDYDNLTLVVSLAIEQREKHPKLWMLIPKTFRSVFEAIFETYRVQGVRRHGIYQAQKSSPKGDDDDEDWGPSNLQ